MKKLKQLLEYMCKLLCHRKYPEKFKFTYTSLTSSGTINKALLIAFPNATIRMHDSFYHAVKWEDLVKWLIMDSLSEMKWLKDVFDCDDFADESSCRMHELGRLQEKNFAYRIAWGITPMGYHAFCIAYVVKDGKNKLIIIEPQNDDTKDWKMSDYKPDFIKF